MIIQGSIRLSFTYAAGRIGSRFLSGLRDSSAILGAHCPRCELVVCPARAFCPVCSTGMDDLREVGPGGTVQAWSEVPGKGTYGMIRLDGADTALVHRLVGDAGLWEPGARVVARFATNRIGSITDIEGFERGES